MDTILVVNAGSSSVKFQVFSVDGGGSLERRIKGQMDGVGTKPRLRATDADGGAIADRTYPTEQAPDVSSALGIAGAWLRDELRITPIAVGHRVVHGGPEYDGPVLIDPAVVSRLDRLTSLAPLQEKPRLFRAARSATSPTNGMKLAR
jgi:acetate kinase